MERPLDRIDFALLGALQEDARSSNKELAAKAHLAQSSCHARVRRLHERGVILGTTVDLDAQGVGIGLQALVFVRLKQHDREAVLAFRRHAGTLPEVVQVFHIAGRFDFIIRLAFRDANHLRDVAMDAFTTREEVAQIETHLLFEATRSELPLYPDPDLR